MVSQEFMNILRKQSHHNTPTTSHSNASMGIEGRPLNIREEGNLLIKEEQEDYDDIGESSVETINVEAGLIVKEEEEEDYCKDWKPFLPQTLIKSDCNREPSPLHNTSTETKKVLIPILPPESPQQLEREENIHVRPPGKRIVKKKIIFDPSDTSIPSQRKKTLHKGKISDSHSSLTIERCMESPELPSEEVDDDYDDECKTCKYCGMYVKRKDYMRLHLMIHTGETPHKCPHCRNAYRTRWRLKQHIRTHTKILPYHCPYCNYRGNRSDYLTSHVRRIHNKGFKQSINKCIEPEVKIQEECNVKEES